AQFRFECDGKSTLSPGGQFSICLDKSRKSVKIVSVSDPKRDVHPPFTEAKEIFSVAATPDGKLLGVGFRAGGIKLIDTQSRKLLMSKIEGSDGVVTFSADGKYFGAAVANRASTALKVE